MPARTRAWGVTPDGTHITEHEIAMTRPFARSPSTSVRRCSDFDVSSGIEDPANVVPASTPWLQPFPGLPSKAIIASGQVVAQRRGCSRPTGETGRHPYSERQSDPAYRERQTAPLCGGAWCPTRPLPRRSRRRRSRPLQGGEPGGADLGILRVGQDPDRVPGLVAGPAGRDVTTRLRVAAQFGYRS